MNNQQRHVCPVCDAAFEDTSAIYTHLQVNHRKSELSKAVLELGDSAELSPRAE